MIKRSDPCVPPTIPRPHAPFGLCATFVQAHAADDYRPRAELSASTPPLLSVIIPVYNEQNTIAAVVRKVKAVPIPKEIIIVDDGSHDETGPVLAALGEEPGLRVIRHDKNQGKGAALKTGFLHATGDIVLIQDADLEYDPVEYPGLLRPILAGEADVVYGSRFHAAGPTKARHFWHTLGNQFLTALSNWFTRLKLTDMETCYKVFRRDLLQHITPTLKQQRFGIEPELTAKVARRGLRVHEVPIRYAGRSYREGKKIGWRDGVKALWCIVRYWKYD